MHVEWNKVRVFSSQPVCVFVTHSCIFWCSWAHCSPMSSDIFNIFNTVWRCPYFKDLQKGFAILVKPSGLRPPPEHQGLRPKDVLMFFVDLISMFSTTSSSWLLGILTRTRQSVLVSPAPSPWTWLMDSSILHFAESTWEECGDPLVKQNYTTFIWFPNIRPLYTPWVLFLDWNLVNLFIVCSSVFGWTETGHRNPLRTVLVHQNRAKDQNTAGEGASRRLQAHEWCF